MEKINSLSVMNAQHMTSLEIAQVTGKMHKDVMKANGAYYQDIVATDIVPIN